jgi:hypothetical protein
MSVVNTDVTQFKQRDSSRSSAKAIAQQNPLVARSLDGLLVGWLGVAIWFVAMMFHRSGRVLDLYNPVLIWAGTILSAAHFVISYRYAYVGSWSSVRRRPSSLVGGPLAVNTLIVLAMFYAISRGGSAPKTTSGYLMGAVVVSSGYHYIKQTYGIARLGISYAGLRLTRIETRVLRFGLFPFWLRNVTALFFQNRITGTALSSACAISAAMLLWVAVRFAYRNSVRPPAVMIAPYVSAILWMAFPMSLVGSGVILAALHAVQYLACCHSAEKSLADPAGSATSRSWSMIKVFGLAGCIGVFLTATLPAALDQRFPIHGNPNLFTAMAFVSLNLTHYLIDAVIWRADSPLIRSMQASQPSQPSRAMRNYGRC